MKPTWRKIWYPDGSTEVLEHGEKVSSKPEFECIPMHPPTPYPLISRTEFLLTDRATAEKMIRARPDVYSFAGVPNAAKSVNEPDWCNRCAGSGRIHVDWDWSSGIEEHITERCPQCGGSGKLDDEDDNETDM